ncbi:cyclophilin-like fold protein [Lachnospiraceae bacterium KK002]
MHDYGSFEKVGETGNTLPRNDERITTEPGDVILYPGTSITIY